MNHLISSLKETAESLSNELDKAVNADGSVKNKAALARARKLTSQLAKQGKEFRAESIKAQKGL